MSGEALNPRARQRIAEAKIEAAIRDGAFANLPGFGQPLPDDLETPDENWWLKRKAKLEGLNLLPPALELRRVVERELARITMLPSDQAVRDAVERLNQQIRAANLRITWGPPSTVMPLDVAKIVAHAAAARTKQPHD